MSSLRTRLLLLLVLGGVLALRHLQLFYTETNILHLEPLADSLERIIRGELWMVGQELGESRVTFGGPLYTWLSYPAVLLSHNPVTGLHLCYYLLELAGLTVWMLWPAPRLEQGIRYLGGMMLALYPEAKVELCENATVMAYLLPPLLVTFLWALRHRAWRSMLLPGLLLGAAVQVHALAAVLAPALALAVLWDRQLWLRRLLVLAGGGLLAGAITFNAESYSAGQGGDIWRYIWDHFSSPRMALGLLHLVKDPLVLVGLAVMLGRWRGGQRPSAVQVLALAWLVSGVLGASVVYARETTIFFPFMPRFALINPGRVILAGAGALWLLGQINRLPFRWTKNLGPAGAMVAALGVATVYMVPALAAGPARLDREFERTRAAPCLCELLDSHNLSRFRKRSFDTLLEMPSQISATVIVEPYDRLGRELSTAQIWQQTGARARRGAPGAGTVVALPRSPLLDLQSIPGVRSYGSLLAIPGCSALDPAALTDQGTLNLELGGHRRPGDRLLLLHFARRQDRSFALRLKVRTAAGAHTLTPRELCHCRGGHSFVGGWYLFDLRGQPYELDAFRLQSGGRPGEDWKVQGHFLPAARWFEHPW